MCKQDNSSVSLETKNIEDSSDSSSSDSSSASSSGSERNSDSSSDSESGSASSDSGSSSNSSSNDDNNGKNEVPSTEKKESPKKPTSVRNTVNNNSNRNTNKSLERKTTASSTKAIKKTQPTTTSKQTNSSDDDDSTSSSESTPAPSPKKIPKVMSSSVAKRAAANKQQQQQPQTSSTQHSHPPGGGKAPPSVVKQHQQNFVKSQQNRAKNPITKPGSILKTKKKAQNKKTANVESSDEESSEDSDRKRKKVTTQKAGNSSNKSKTATYSSSSSSSTTSSSESSDEGSNSQSSKSSEKTKKPTTKPLKKSSSGVNLSESEKDDKETQLVTPTKNPIRKLTRSSSTRKSKHVNPKKTSESESELDIDKRSSTKSPAKRPSNSKVKRDLRDDSDRSPPIPPPPTPPPDEQKCPVEGCDSSGHLSGNQDKHYLPEACPIYHNMSTSECKERYAERKLRDKEIDKILGSYKNCTDKQAMIAEQKAFLAKIHEKRNHFEEQKNLKGGVDPAKKEIECDIAREPNLVGLTSEYDLNLFREAQAIASERIEEELKDVVVGKGIKYVIMGKYQMKVWYQSPYPDDTTRIPKMYICEFCLRYQKSEIGIKRHASKCRWRHPPGDEIYRKGKLQVWQVDGKKHKQYCQHLCLLAKFFLDHKTLYYDVEPFLFYIMTLADTDGCHTVGYFSKEKNSFYNVSCILTLPPYQRKGYGRLLIDFSYLLTKTEDKIGSPEKPLSDLGLISYRSYWKDKLLNYLCSRGGSTLTIKDISTEMAIYSYDIVSTLQALGMIKYWKGKHIVLKKQDVLEDYQDRIKRKTPIPRTDSGYLRWVPFVPKQNNLNTN